jgi:hypothetical protein
MNTRPPFEHDELLRRISRDLTDGYDEELEMEIEDRHPLPGVSSAVESDAEKDYRRTYFQQLFRLQAELVKLQDWVVASALCAEPAHRRFDLHGGRRSSGAHRFGQPSTTVLGRSVPLSASLCQCPFLFS